VSASVDGYDFEMHLDDELNIIRPYEMHGPVSMCAYCDFLDAVLNDLKSRHVS
jgi:hypothetical protein